MFVLGFQEIVPLTAKNVVGGSSANQYTYWEEMIKNSLDSQTEFFQENDKYVKIRSEQLVGLFIIIYVKRCLRPFIKDIAAS